MARAWLQHLRDSAIFKVEGLDPAQLRWQPAPAANSLGVIVVHLGLSERLWLRAIGAGEPMDMAWRVRMFELPEGWGAEEAVARGLLARTELDLPLDEPIVAARK